MCWMLVWLEYRFRGVRVGLSRWFQAGGVCLLAGVDGVIMTAGGKILVMGVVTGVGCYSKGVGSAVLCERRWIRMLGRTPDEGRLFGGTQYVGGRLKTRSIFEILHHEGDKLLNDEKFADLYSDRGRRSIPPRIVVTVMILQCWFGLSDREAVEAFEFDARWKYACGSLHMEYPGFSHTVLVAMRARLAKSDDPDRIFATTVQAARSAGLVTPKRALDSTPIHDAVATQDTVTMLYCLMRKLLEEADPQVAARLREVLVRVDYDTKRNKPRCQWDDPQARAQIVEDLAGDAFGCLRVLEDLPISETISNTVGMLKVVLGQNICEDSQGRWCLVRGVAKDRLISIVDPDARHGRKSTSSRHDGYKGHIAEDPDSEIITATAVTPANTPDGDVAQQLIQDLLQTHNTTDTDTDTDTDDDDTDDTDNDDDTDDTDDDDDDTDDADTDDDDTDDADTDDDDTDDADTDDDDDDTDDADDDDDDDRRRR